MRVWFPPLPIARSYDLFLVQQSEPRGPDPAPKLGDLGPGSPPTPSPAPVASDSPRRLRLQDWRSGGRRGGGCWGGRARAPAHARLAPAALPDVTGAGQSVVCKAGARVRGGQERIFVGTEDSRAAPEPWTAPTYSRPGLTYARARECTQSPACR